MCLSFLEPLLLENLRLPFMVQCLSLNLYSAIAPCPISPDFTPRLSYWKAEMAAFLTV